MGDKKGAMSVSFIIGLVIVLFGFAVLLFFYYQIAQGFNVDREVCHTSVVTRGTLPSIAQDVVPLKCQTQKICISGKLIGRGNCEEFENEKSVKTIRVSNSADSLEKIERAYAMEMLDCWTMMGAGELSLYSQALAKESGFGVVYPTCVICSRVAVDEESLNEVDFSKMDLYDYMARHVVPETDKTYLQIISGKDNSGFSLKEGSFSLDINDDENVNGEFEFEDSFKLEDTPKETAILFMQISAPQHKKVFSNTFWTATGITTATGFSATGRSVAIRIAKATGLKGGVIGAALVAAGLGVQHGFVAYNRAVTASKCSVIGVGDEAVEGCSVLGVMDYETENILKYCGVVESIP